MRKITQLCLLFYQSSSLVKGYLQYISLTFIYREIKTLMQVKFPL